jgi:amino acid transporter
MDNFDIIRGVSFTDLGTLLGNVINWVLGFAALVAVLFIIYGGILYISSSGNEGRVENAKKTITNAVLGLIVIILSFFIVNFVIATVKGFF